jgi:hypothetical protein
VGHGSERSNGKSDDAARSERSVRDPAAIAGTVRVLGAVVHDFGGRVGALGAVASQLRG